MVRVGDKYAPKEFRRSEDELSYALPSGFEHRYDVDSSIILYSLIRHFKPRYCLEIGSWKGGTTCVTMDALIKNNLPFQFVVSELVKDLQIETVKNCLEQCGMAPAMVGDITKCSLIALPPKFDLLVIDIDHDQPTSEWIIKNIFPLLRTGALVAIHDWAVKDIDGQWIEKDDAWPETKYLIDLRRKGKLPLEKLYWNYTGQGSLESSFWVYKSL